MNIIIVTRDIYLEKGLAELLKGYNTTTGQELFTLENCRQRLHDRIFVIVCDYQLIRLMSCLFSGRRFIIIPATSVRSLSDIRKGIGVGAWRFGYTERSLTMSEIVILFQTIFNGCRAGYISRQLDINVKTVYSHIYNAMKKNGLCNVSIKYFCGY